MNEQLPIQTHKTKGRLATGKNALGGGTMQATRKQLLEFVERIALLEYDPPENQNITQEDCASERNELIEEALRIPEN
jgi:hypothetical protein